MKKLLSLDISTHTGWSYFEDGKLVKFGKYDIEVEGYKAEIKSYKDYPKIYPSNFVKAANDQLVEVKKLLEEFSPDLVVIEETNKSRQRFSQKILEWTHFVVVSYLLETKQQFVYLTTACWRRQVRCYLKEWPEYKKWNSKVGRAKQKAVPTKAGAKVAKIEGKIVSSIDQKKLSVILANQHYGLDLPLSENDIADSINLGRATWELGIVMSL